MSELSEIEKSGVFDLRWLGEICAGAGDGNEQRKHQLLGIYLACRYDAPWINEFKFLFDFYTKDFE